VRERAGFWKMAPLEGGSMISAAAKSAGFHWGPEQRWGAFVRLTS
jgi:hypothetical protein